MNESTYCFGDFRLIPALREAWQSEQLIPVQPRVFDTLVYLIQHRDRAVGRDELISAVWGRVDLTDNVLCQIVGRARQLVGDTGEAQHSIRTISRFGYRWVRDLDVLSAQTETEQVDMNTEADIPPAYQIPAASRPHWTVAAMTLVLLCATCLISQASNAPIENGAAAATTLDAKLAHVRDALKHDRLDQARAIVRAFSDHDRARPDVRFETAELASKEGRYADALNANTALLADVGQSDPLIAGKAAAGAGWAEFVQGMDHYPTARRYYEQAIDLLRPLQGTDARLALGRVWSRLGGLHTNLVEFDAAERAYTQARIALEGIGDRSALGRLESNVGLMLTYQYRATDALPRLQRAADLCAQADDASCEAGARMNLVNIYLAQLRPAEALPSEPRLRDLRDRLGDPIDTSQLDLARADVLMANGRLNEAEIVLNGLAGRPTQNDPQLTAIRDLAASTLARGRANWKEAAASIQKALSSAWYVPDSGAATQARWKMIEALRALDDVPGIVKAAEASDAQANAYPDAPDIGLYAALARGTAAAAQGDEAKARKELNLALTQAEQNHSPYDLLQVYSAYAPFLIQQGEQIKARAMADRLDDWANHDFDAALVQLDIYHALGSEAWLASLDRARRLAGERIIPPALAAPSGDAETADARVAVAE